MLRNILLIAYRNLRNNRILTSINIAGLTIAFTSCLIIFLYVRFETNYDSFHENADRIYRVTYDETATGLTEGRHLATVSPPVGPALVEEFPEIESAVRFRPAPGHILGYNDLRFHEDNLFYVDNTLLEVFSFELVSGNPETAMVNPNSILITETVARKYFGEEDPMGKVMLLDNDEPFTVTGILKDLPPNTHIDFDIVIPFEAFRVPFGYPVTLESWGWISFHTYVQLRPDVTPQEVESKFPDFVNLHFQPERAARFVLRLQNLKEIYLGDIKNTDIRSGNNSYINAMIAVGIIIILIATFNYTNLTTAYSVSRSREVGIRKVMGAQKKALVVQFLLESVSLSLLSVTVAFGLLYAGQSYIPGLDSMGFLTGFLNWGEYLPIAILCAVLIGLIGGLYPAFVLSGFRLHEVLKGRFKSSTSGIILRRTLVFIQFTITATLIIGSLVVNDQIRFIGNKDLGFDQEEVIVLEVIGNQLDQRYDGIRNVLVQNPNVVSVSIGGGLLDGDNGNVPLYPEGDFQQDGFPVAIESVKEGWFETMGIDFRTGRAFSKDFPNDSADAVILNEAAIQLFDWGPEEALGKQVRISNIMEGNVIGVVSNYHFASLHDQIRPLALYMPRGHLSYIFIRVSPGNVQSIIESIQRDWQTVASDLPFDFLILNDHLNQLYHKDLRFSGMVSVFSYLAIFIACLGLYALVSLSIIQKFKDLGIRKLMGASVTNIFVLITRQFLLLVIFANLVAWPLAYIFMKGWLDGFAYSVGVHWYTFAIATVAVFLIALLTIAYKVLKAASLNPVDVLRTE